MAVTRTLPRDIASFTGREPEVRELTGAVGSGSVAAIHAIGGMPGVGKTALAVHVAHLLRSLFSDRQLFMDLHAHTPGQDPVAPEAALAGLLTAVGVDARYLPEDLEGRVGLWRDRMADQRALLVLDNAVGSAQVTPLLPGGDRCLVLVTSRRHLGDLPGMADPVLLGVLPPDQAQAIFLRLAPRAADGPTAAVQELARLAGYLPLAISLLARVYSRHPSWTLADLTLETRTSMLTLAAENDSVAAAFEVSYRYLAPGQQRFFRRMGQHLGTTIDAYAAAASADIPLHEAARLLDDLHGEGLLTEAGYRRYGMHDLIRRYAWNLAAADPAADRRQGLDRLLDYYQHAAAITQARLARQCRNRPAPAPAILTPPHAAVPDLHDRERALSWARTERANLMACLDHVTRTGQHAHVVALTAAMAALLRQDGPWTDAIARHAIAVQAATALGDLQGQANVLSDLGVVRWLTGDYRSAVEVLETALGICGGLGDRLGEANALHCLGVIRRRTGDYQSGAEALETALAMYRDLGNQLGEANALNCLGDMRRRTQEHRGAAEAHEAALRIYRSFGDGLGQANALKELGALRRLTGDYLGAAEALETALGIYRDLGNRGGEVGTLNELGTLRRVRGDLDRAGACHRKALDLAREIGGRWDEAHALAGLGHCTLAVGRTAEAEANLRQAWEIFQRIGAAEAIDVAAELDALTHPQPTAER